MIDAVKYEPQHEKTWNEFVRLSRNGVFLFDRNYMDYHADRFEDHSLLFFHKQKLVALAPANRAGEALVSHGGLTFGGVVSGPRMNLAVMKGVFEALRDHMAGSGMRKLIYKAVPHIYHKAPSEEDLYCLFRHGAILFRRDVSASILMADRPRYSKGRKWSVKKGKKSGIVVEESGDYEAFMAIEEARLGKKYGAKPVHSAEEVKLLARRFPDRIRLFAGLLEGRMLGGVLVYESDRVAHAQYIGATDEGRELGALDVVIDHLLGERYAEKPYFDFGISTEQEGRFLNEPLAANKESFGGRATAYDFYEIDWERY